MKNCDSKKSALLLTMIIGEQFLGSKGVLATGAGVVLHKDHPADQVSVNTINAEQQAHFDDEKSQSESKMTDTWEEVLKNAEGNREGKIYRMMGVAFKGLTDKQIQSVIIEMYASMIKDITTSNGLKNRVVNSIELLQDFGEDNVSDFDEEEVPTEEESMLKKVVLDGKAEFDKRWGDFTLELAKAGVDYNFGGEESNGEKNGDKKPAKSVEYINEKFMKKGKTARAFIDAVNEKMIEFLDNINDKTSVWAIEEGILSITRLTNHFYELKQNLYYLIETSEDMNEQQVAEEKKRIKKQTEVALMQRRPLLTEDIMKLIGEGNKVKVSQIKKVLDEYKCLKPTESFEAEAEIEIQIDELEGIDFWSMKRLDNELLNSGLEQGLLTEIDDAVEEGCKLFWTYNSKDQMKKKYKKDIFVLEDILSRDKFVKVQELKTEMETLKDSIDIEWIGNAKELMYKNNKNKAITEKIVKTIQEWLIKNLPDDEKKFFNKDRENYNDIKRVTIGNILKTTRSFFMRLNKKEKIDKLIKDWNADKSIPIGIVEFKDKDIIIEREELEKIVEKIKQSD